MKKRFVLLCASLLFLVFVQPSYAWGEKKKKTDKTDKKEEKTETAYERLFKKPHAVTKGEFITIHRVGDKIYFEYPLKYMGRDLLVAFTPSATSDPGMVNIGYKSNDPLHVKFQLEDSTVFLMKRKTYTNFDKEDQNTKEVIRNNFMDVKFKKMKLEAYNPDSTAIVFDMTGFFTEKNPDQSPIGGYIGGFVLGGELKPELTSIGTIKAFGDNISIETKDVYKCFASYFIFMIPFGDVAVNTTKSILLLPEEKMKPRVSDPRVGIFLTGKQCISAEEGSRYYSYANRWRLEPKDQKAWENGELVEPKKPIVYYVDNTFPKNWKAPIREAVLVWNQAFEKIGFKNAVQVKDFPLNDPSFDPDNLKYSCIRYCPAGIANAMGPSWVDPTTGEIVNASVIIYNDMVKLITQWRFVQTAQLDERVRGKKLPEEELYKSIVYVVAHEIGHTMGLMHNMAASAAFPVDSLRSASFTQKYGTTPSIMDYARFNYVAQPGDKGVKLTPPDLGVYDEYAIKWLYSPVAGNKTVEEETAFVQKWVDEKAGDPIYRYGQQQPFVMYDPTAQMEDLGDDPIKAGDYGIRNLKYILPNVNTWITNDDFSETRMELYTQILIQYFRYVSNVVCQIGGTKLTNVKEGTTGERYEPMSREVQKASMRWVIKQLQNSDWVNDPVLSKNLFSAKYSNVLQNAVGNMLFSLGPNVILCSHLSEKPYTIREYYDDLYEGVWGPTVQGKKLTTGEKLLQRSCVFAAFVGVKQALNPRYLAENSLPFETGSKLSVDEIVQYGLDKTGFVRRYQDQLRKFELENGQGIVANNLLTANIMEPDPYKWRRKVNVEMIDESFAYHTAMLEKVQSLLKSRLASANPDDKAHYQAILLQIQAMSK